VPATGADKPIAATLQQHRLEITAFHAIGTTNRFGCVKRSRMDHKHVHTRRLRREQAPKYAILGFNPGNPGLAAKASIKRKKKNRLEQIPQELVIDLVMELYLLGFDECSQRSGAAIRRGLL
jgi:hypothetical protein